MNRNIHNLDRYDYELDKKFISSYPLEKRENSKLLVYRDNKIVDSNFKHISDHLPKNSTLFFNDSKVLNGRLLFANKNNAKIEILVTDKNIPRLLNKKSPLLVDAIIGNNKKWKKDEVLEKKIDDLIISASKNENKVKLEWNKDLIFDKILSKIGIIPLPPYLKRDAEDSDYDNYQTVYSQKKGSIAAPTAGLHFNHNIINEIEKKNTIDFFTLHVGLGTFKPITNENIQKHEMHSEEIVITKQNILKIYEANNITAVGTTSLRVLESIYYLGSIIDKQKKEFQITQNVINKRIGISLKESCEQIINYLEIKKINELKFRSKIFIYPGYSFKVCDQLITNFHYPKSTLIILIAAFIGDDWKKVYKFAKENKYRFLSYGDSSLLFRR